KEKCLLTILSGPRSSWFLVYRTQLSIRGQGASMPLATRLESSKRCYWFWQTSGWNEWAEKTVAAPPATFHWVRYTRKRQIGRSRFGVKGSASVVTRYRARPTLNPERSTACKAQPAEPLRFFPAQSGQPEVYQSQ